jgi:hypothetical protein
VRHRNVACPASGAASACVSGPREDLPTATTSSHHITASPGLNANVAFNTTTRGSWQREALAVCVAATTANRDSSQELLASPCSLRESPLKSDWCVRHPFPTQPLQGTSAHQGRSRVRNSPFLQLLSMLSFLSRNHFLCFYKFSLTVDARHTPPGVVNLIVDIAVRRQHDLL